MLNRQRALIGMLRRARRPVSRLELVKWAFVLRQESETGGGPSFYDFLPYQHGPYSFTLTRELEGLLATGYVLESGKSWELGNIFDDGNLPATICRDVDKIVSRFRSKPLDDLLNYVYHNYPAFTVNSVRERLAVRPSAIPAVYTAGYEGLQVDGFLNLLIQSGIERLIDVRRNPIARRFGFHKSTLVRLCGSVGITYEHVAELGIASEFRQSLESEADYLALFESYETTTLVSEQQAVTRVAAMVVEKPSVLVCMEANPCCCHRSRLANEVSRRTELPIVHLGVHA